MYILNQEKNDSGQYHDIESWAGLTAPPGFYWWPDNLDQTQFKQYHGFVNIKVARNTVVSYEPSQSEFDVWEANELVARKIERIADSKQQLSEYLLAHPMKWTDGHYYTITAEKQQQLTSKIMSATLAAQMSQPYSLTWNSTGEECQSWTLENLTALAFAIDERVTALVSYQQEQEVAMRDAPTMEALEAIAVNYDSVT